MSKLIDFFASGLSRAALVLAASATLTLPPMAALATTSTDNNQVLHDHVALVIGNAKYAHAPTLLNPVDDAKAISGKLKDLHFDVVEDYDVDENGLRAKVGEFEEKVATAKVALVYYAGHGVTYKSENYLLPVDFQIKQGQDPGLHSLTVSSILNQLGSEDRVTIVILDACRDNALEQDGNRGMSRGLAPVEDSDSRGAMVVYSTAPFKTALDGAPGEHSPFAQALIDHLEDQDVPVEDMITRVRREVYAKTHQRQTPWTSSALLGDEFKLNPASVATAGLPAAAAPVPAPVAPPQPQPVALPPADTPAKLVVAPVPLVTPSPQVVTPAPVVAPPLQAVAPAPVTPPAPPVAQPAAPVPTSTVTAALEPAATPDASSKWRSEIGTPDGEKMLNLTPAIVKKIQVHLQIIRLFHGPVSGNIDDASTRDALLAWQKKEGVEPTQRLGPEQLEALLAITPDRPKPGELLKEIGNVTTQSGLQLSSDETREIQQRLVSSGYMKGTPSGKFDAATGEAISRFQKDEGVPATGWLAPLQLQQFYARTESRYEDMLETGAAGVATTTREAPAPSHVYSGYNHGSGQRHYSGNGAGSSNPFGQFVHGLGVGVGAVLGSRLH